MEVKDTGQGGQIFYSTASSSSVKEYNNTVKVTNTSNIVDAKPESTQNNQQKSMNLEETKKAVDKLNKLMEDTPTHLEYEIYGKFNDLLVRVVDDNTKKVVQEIPPKKIIDMVNKLCELAGFFLDKKV